MFFYYLPFAKSATILILLRYIMNSRQINTENKHKNLLRGSQPHCFALIVNLCDFNAWIHRYHKELSYFLFVVWFFCSFISILAPKDKFSFHLFPPKITKKFVPIFKPQSLSPVLVKKKVIFIVISLQEEGHQSWNLDGQGLGKNLSARIAFPKKTFSHLN